MKSFLTVLLLSSLALAQGITASGGNLTKGGRLVWGATGAATVLTPTVVNFSGMPSSETGALGTQSNFDAGFCPSLAYCAQLTDASLPQNAILVFYKYKPASGNTADIPTISDDQGNAYTHCGTDANDSTNNFYLGCYYKLLATTGTRAITLAFANADTNVAVATVQLANILSFDVYNKNSGTATTTFTSGSATSTANGDLWFELACGTTTLTNVGAFTKGSQAGVTWNSDLLDRRDACAIQHGIQTTAGALNPQLTAASNSFVALGVAFKAGSVGTLPSGMYVSHLYHVSSAVGSASLVYQVPTTGNLIAMAASGGASVAPGQIVTGISDTTNGTWTACPGSSAYDLATSAGYYFANASPGDLAVTMTVTNSGDTGPAVFYDIAGAATTQECHSASAVNNGLGTGTTFTSMTGWVPSASAGISIAANSFDFNTSLGTTVGGQDCFTFGGQSLSGPSYPDQNNGCSHWSFSNNTPHDITWNVLSSSQDVQVAAQTEMGFQAPAATLYPVAVKHISASATASATTVATASYTPVHSGDTLACFVHAFGITTGTISVADPTNGTYTAVDGPLNAAGARSATFYEKNISATAVVITATFGTTNTQRSIMCTEYANVSTTAPLDQHNLLAATAGTGGLITGTSVTTLSANEGLFGAVLCANNCLVSNGTFSGAQQPWTQGNGDTFDNVTVYLSSGATNSFAVTVLDSGGNGSADLASIMTFQQ